MEVLKMKNKLLEIREIKARRYFHSLERLVTMNGELHGGLNVLKDMRRMMCLENELASQKIDFDFVCRGVHTEINIGEPHENKRADMYLFKKWFGDYISDYIVGARYEPIMIVREINKFLMRATPKKETIRWAEVIAVLFRLSIETISLLTCEQPRIERNVYKGGTLISSKIESRNSSDRFSFSEIFE